MGLVRTSRAGGVSTLGGLYSRTKRDTDSTGRGKLIDDYRTSGPFLTRVSSRNPRVGEV